ncbi:MAG: class I SAM-dependent methyltransferase [Thermoanaerobaculia bacterium]
MMCSVCGEEHHATSVVAGLTLRRCTRCGLRTSVIPRGGGTSYADVDDAAYLQSIGRVRQAQAAEIVAFARAHANGDWLDVGCGYGFVLDAARAAGFRVRGIEPDAKAARVARERIGDVETGFLHDGTPQTDVLSTLDVLEHLDDINAFAQLVKRKVRALWVIKVPSADGLLFRIAHALRIRGAIERLWQSRYEHPHRVYFDERTLHRFLRKHGFEVVATHYLEEMPTSTVVERLTLDAAIPRWKARLAVPAVALINTIEQLRSRSDAMLVIARPPR